jgi:hypothetical protein
LTTTVIFYATGNVAPIYVFETPSVLASFLVTILVHMALQVGRVIKIADWLSQDRSSVERNNEVVVGNRSGVLLFAVETDK